MYVKPDLLDKTHAKHTYVKIRTRKNAVFRDPPVPETLEIYRRNTEHRQKHIKNKLLNRNVRMDLCGKYRANRGLAYKNLFHITIF